MLRGHARAPDAGTLRPCHCCGEPSVLARRFVVRGHDIVRCGRCGLQYVNRLPSPGELDKIYGAEFFAVGRKFEDDDRSPGMINAHARVDAMGKLPNVGWERWLDVGCATGQFLLCAAGRAGSVQGVELSPAAAARAAERGLDVAVGDFLEVPVPANGFDVVSMWDYIEHVPDPVAHLRRASDALRPGGYLALSTGNVDSLMAGITGRYWHLMIPPRHLYFFAPATIARLLAAAGFDLVEIGTPGKRVPLDFLAWKLTWLAVPAIAPRVVALSERIGLGRLAPRVNLRDIMTVYARKPEAASVSGNAS